MSGAFMGPPWQMDWVDTARAARDSLPQQVRGRSYAEEVFWQ
ncbi:hypothetical protein [Streptomyces sp. NPDC059708]